MSHDTQKLPAVVTAIVLPLINLLVALVLAGLVVWLIGEDPLLALGYLIEGAFGYEEAVGYTFYYATNFIFTGLAVFACLSCGALQHWR